MVRCASQGQVCGDLLQDKTAALAQVYVVEADAKT